MIDIPPTKLPKIIRYNLAFLFKIVDTDNKSKKSMAIFKNITKSTYIFVLSPPLLAYKKDTLFRVEFYSSNKSSNKSILYPF